MRASFNNSKFSINSFCKRCITPFILIVTLLINSACSTTSVRRKADHLTDIDSSNYRVLILPPVAEVYMLGMSKKTRMYDYEYQLEGILADQISSKIDLLGFKSTKLLRRELFERSLLREFESLYIEYSGIREKLYKKIALDPKEAFTIVENLGPHSTIIANSWGADFLVFINYIRTYKDGASKAVGLVLDLVTGSSNSGPADNSTIIIAIVNAKNGNILWTNLNGDTISSFGNTSSEDKVIIQRIGNILNPLFKPLEKDLNSLRK